MNIEETIRTECDDPVDHYRKCPICGSAEDVYLNEMFYEKHNGVLDTEYDYICSNCNWEFVYFCDQKIYDAPKNFEISISAGNEGFIAIEKSEHIKFQNNAGRERMQRKNHKLWLRRFEVTHLVNIEPAFPQSICLDDIDQIQMIYNTWDPKTKRNKDTRTVIYLRK
jgi:hypothetical protein